MTFIEFKNLLETSEKSGVDYFLGNIMYKKVGFEDDFRK